MAKYKKKPTEVEAMQWFGYESGHPYVDEIEGGDNILKFGLTLESAQIKCQRCGHEAIYHGRVATIDGLATVCPGDWIITENGQHTVCKPDIFEMTYEKVEKE